MTAPGVSRSLVGARGRIVIGGLDFDVLVLDTRSVYGRLELRVRPVRGAGDVWIKADRFTPIAREATR